MTTGKVVPVKLLTMKVAESEVVGAVFLLSGILALLVIQRFVSLTWDASLRATLNPPFSGSIEGSRSLAEHPAAFSVYMAFDNERFFHGGRYKGSVCSAGRRRL